MEDYERIATPRYGSSSAEPLLSPYQWEGPSPGLSSFDPLPFEAIERAVSEPLLQTRSKSYAAALKGDFAGSTSGYAGEASDFSSPSPERRSMTVFKKATSETANVKHVVKSCTGEMTEVSVTDTNTDNTFRLSDAYTWTEQPTSPLLDRNSLIHADDVIHGESVPYSNTTASNSSGIKLLIDFTPEHERISVVRAASIVSTTPSSGYEVATSIEHDNSSPNQTSFEQLSDSEDYTDSEVEFLPRNASNLSLSWGKIFAHGVSAARVHAQSTRKICEKNILPTDAAYITNSDSDHSTSATTYCELEVNHLRNAKDRKKKLSKGRKSSRNQRRLSGRAKPKRLPDGEDAGTDEETMKATPSDLLISQPLMKRKHRMVDPADPSDALLIAAATKCGKDYYDSDAKDRAGKAPHTAKPELFRNVKWGIAADECYTGYYPSYPEFTQFVPGRWERNPDGTVSDQKYKLIVRFTDKQGVRRIFTNAPPKDWNNQEAITALNKRTVQQIRRNTDVRFREVVTAYVQEERNWILQHLNAGKPSNGWKRFVDDFNMNFAGKKFGPNSEPRPARTHSSLTKEVERFGARYYSKGVVPIVGGEPERKRQRKA